MPDETQAHAELARAIADAALLRGSFTLRSGRTSSYYLDKYLFTTRPELLRPVAAELAARIEALERELGRTATRLAGAELGGVPLVTAVGLEMARPFVLVRNQKKDYGTAKQHEGLLESGDRLVMVEDVTTTGGQAIEAVRALRSSGAEVLGVITVIDRLEGAAEAFEAEGVAFGSLFTRTDLGITD